ALVTPDGRFDANAGGMQSIRFSRNNQTVNLKQLKSERFESGLLARILGYNSTPLPMVAYSQPISEAKDTRATSIDPSVSSLSVPKALTQESTPKLNMATSSPLAASTTTVTGADLTRDVSVIRRRDVQTPSAPRYPGRSFALLIATDKYNGFPPLSNPLR